MHQLQQRNPRHLNLIDIQLGEAGWTADSKNIRHGKDSRPQKNENIAIAEWPTDSGPAD
ncbi:hypothetical protein U8335_09460 [Roseiconus lacunae]|uniref:hypothetical protein n=1 Tax=Roseiconus lacunae TaxID=2605694 RepID=UPI00308DA304|nr:hypothetical protein U8335_09460 [Stieleria sp. HD01]